MVIVTQNQYILASKIHHVTLHENIENFEYRDGGGRYRGKIIKKYTVSVYYTPDDATPNPSLGRNNNDVRECSVELRGALNAHTVFKDLIRQIREQMPDQLYLDTALERMIASMDEEVIKAKDNDFEMEDANDRKPKKVRRTRKKKRRS